MLYIKLKVGSYGYRSLYKNFAGLCVETGTQFIPTCFQKGIFSFLRLLKVAVDSTIQSLRKINFSCGFCIF